MEIKFFGKSVFEAKGKSEILIGNSRNKLKESEFLPNFSNTGNYFDSSEFIIMDPSGAVTKKKPKKEKPKGKELTPKEVFELKMLNDNEFEINVDSDYIEKQIEDFKDKLNLIQTSNRDMERGVDEIGSILIRMENRKQYSRFNDYFDEYPYTTTTKIDELVKAHENLKLGTVEQFIADLPNEATQAMKEYTKQCKELCDKKPLFFIIADKKDFKNTNKRRDPILLAQSPFGHFWQILGAWDDEVLFLEEL